MHTKVVKEVITARLNRQVNELLASVVASLIDKQCTPLKLL